jgi:hypothetical protein
MHIIKSRMKKILLTLIIFVGVLALASHVSAQVPVNITPPSEGVNPYTPLGTFISNALRIVFILATLAVLVMLVIGAFNWITSGGDKDAVGKARNRIIAALVGLAVLALAFFLTNVVGNLLGINILGGAILPRLDQCPGGPIGSVQVGYQANGSPLCCAPGSQNANGACTIPVQQRNP